MILVDPFAMHHLPKSLENVCVLCIMFTGTKEGRLVAISLITSPSLNSCF